MSGFEGSSYERVKVHSEVLGRDIEIAAYKAGSGPDLLLLHGFPQTHYIWHKVPKRLSEKYTVVATDLRGYGASDKPKGSEGHVEYSKREMANDQVQVMKHFGSDSFYLLAHDRGARVAHRLALDHPDKVKTMILLDIAPTLWMYEHTRVGFAADYWQLFFAGFGKRGPPVACEDYRAAATIDLVHDRADRDAGHKLRIPALKILWGQKGMIEKMGGAVKAFQAYCEDGVELSGRTVDSGHYIPEEKYDEVVSVAMSFFQ